MALVAKNQSGPGAAADQPNTDETSGQRATMRGGRLVWVIVAAAIPQSLVAAKLLNVAMNPGGMVPGMAILVILVLGGVSLALVWGMVALAALSQRQTLRVVVLVLLTLPDLWCIPNLIEGVIEGARYSQAHPTPDIETGRGYFADQANRDLVVAIRACNPGMQRYGLVCDLDKVAALAHATDVYAPGLTSDSQMSLALQNGPNSDVIRILLRTGKPPEEVLQWVFSKSLDMRDVALLRAGLDAGLDPNGLWGSVDHVLFGAVYYGWTEGVAALLDAGATIDQTDTAGYTALMRAIEARRYQVAALLLARGAAEDRTASYGRTMDALVLKIPIEDRDKMPPSVMALVDRHRAQ